MGAWDHHKRQPDESWQAWRERIVVELSIDLEADARELKRFEQDSKLLYSRYEELVVDHPHWWIGVYMGQFYLAPTYDEWRAKLDEAGVPITRVVEAVLLPKGERARVIPPWANDWAQSAPPWANDFADR